MSALLVPLVAEGPFFGFSVELEGITYRLSFRWNDRPEQWVIDVLDGEGNALVQGVRGVIDVPLLQRFGPRDDLPPGWLMLLDSSGRGLDAALDDLGSRVELYYLTSDQVLEAP